MIPRRFKRLYPDMEEELEWELTVLLLLEEDVYPYLEAQGVPGEEWEYYIAFARRVWERRVHFAYETFLLEKASLLNEFTLRGLNPTHLNMIQLYAEGRALQKLTGVAPPPPKSPWICWYNSCDDLDDWTQTGDDLALSIEEVNIKEVPDSLKATILNQTDEVNRISCEIDNCNHYMGFYYYYRGYADKTGWVLMGFSTDDIALGNIVGFTQQRVVGVGWYAQCWGLGLPKCSRWYFAEGQWAWCEIRKRADNGIYRHFDYYFNGDAKCVYASGLTESYEPTKFVIYVPSGEEFQYVLIDYIRICDRFQYPPTNGVI